MYRVRLHGRGGQGLKTASRMMGTSLFLEGFEVQDAPRYGAERRGAPIFAYVRADQKPIQERGIIKQPDLVIVTDESLVTLTSAEILEGIHEQTVLLICSKETGFTWQARLNLRGPVITLPIPEGADPSFSRYTGSRCIGAGCRLMGVVTGASLESAIREELSQFSDDIINANLEAAMNAYELLGEYSGIVRQGSVLPVSRHTTTDWTRLQSENRIRATPAIPGSLTSIAVKTGLWRTFRPEIDREHCNRCTWVCSSFCPDNAISVDEHGYPRIDLDHCKGCLICVQQCPPHAISAVPEILSQHEEMQPEKRLSR